MKTTTERGQLGSGPFVTATDKRRGIWFAIVVIVVYGILGVFYVMAMI